MSNYMPGGAEAAWEYLAEEDAIRSNEEVLLAEEMENIHWEAINSLYEQPLSWNMSEKFLKLWAQAFKDSEWNDEEAAFIAERLKLGRREMFALLGDKKSLRRELENEKFWRNF